MCTVEKHLELSLVNRKVVHQQNAEIRRTFAQTQHLAGLACTATGVYVAGKHCCYELPYRLIDQAGCLGHKRAQSAESLTAAPRLPRVWDLPSFFSRLRLAADNLISRRTPENQLHRSPPVSYTVVGRGAVVPLNPIWI